MGSSSILVNFLFGYNKKKGVTQEPELILTRILTEKDVIDQKESLK